MRRSVAVLTAGIVSCAAALAGCGTAAEPSDDASAPPSTSSVAPTSTVSASVAQARCEESPPGGPVEHSLQDFAFGSGSATVSLALPGQDSHCYSYPRWGNLDPAVPIDSLLFLFKGPGSDGVTIEMLVGDLTQQTDVNARVTVAIDGTTYQGEGCSVELTALSSAGVSGAFSCPTTTAVFGNPFAPLDDPEPEPPTSAPLATATVSGWFTAAP
ncbi:hypothetical protein [Nocardia sp. 348MFTsu5.1]|uniref:hypothetical protein n=1 Tax=Nocardia sp. 348MFTsu5.1 TaxID=1172185 RepID=UPI0003770FEC|nr:hypothetical protein [Nocardia sp. 348MFTsu5.1]